MRISELFGKERPVFSFEFFPPKTDEGRKTLLTTIADLKTLEPDFVSVTYGAGGSTRDRTVELVAYIKNELRIEAMAHITCVGASRTELSSVLDRLGAAAVENVIALRGDPPRGESRFTVALDGLAHASDLVAMIRSQNRPFCVAAAAYPEGHVEAPSLEEDLDNLKKKVDQGVDFLITQLFFDNRYYFDFVERAKAAGIAVPVVPGIMPVTSNLDKLQRFGAQIPHHLQEAVSRLEGDPEGLIRAGVDHAFEQCRELIDQGAPGVHFYTLNRSASTRNILRQLKSD
ncbi:MAG: methylenetetrahydrofolate reductase [NAD(P)H] [Candidatus Binatia bacterium]